MKLDLPDESVQFLLDVLQNQPLPFVRSAPLIQAISQQAMAQRNPPPAEAPVEAPAA